MDIDSSFEIGENYNPNQSSQNETTNKPTAAKKATKKSSKTIEETYQKKTQLEHILLRPDTYIGSTEPLTQPMFVLNAETNRIAQRDVTYTPGLYKIFDEIVVNAADNKQRDPNMDRMEVTVDAESGTISVLNNGKGIPVVMHKEHNCYVPTLIFGHLLTGSNFDDDEKKTTGGRNGYGAKLANIFSTEFIVECVDSNEGMKFKQVFRNNMHVKEDPKVKKCTAAELKKGDYTKITFKPDLNRFNMTSLDTDTVGLLSKRAYDIAGSMANKEGKKLSVYLNGKKLPVKDFKSYLALFDGITPPAAYEKVGDRWEVGISVSDGSFQQISFVNAIATTKGGGHVNYIADQVAKSLQASVKKKNKGGTEIKPNQIKNHLSVFVNCLVENPTFDSQTKENLTTRPSAFGKEGQLSDKFMKQVEKCGVVDAIMSYAKFKQNQALKRKGGTKKTKLTGITKLDDANNAGTAKSKDCTLIITEGDSAKSLAVSGLSVVGRDFYGVFPLKGKPLNVRDATHSQIMKNEEIMNLVEIMGLKFGTTYTEENIKSLRYGHLMIMADQDHDGSHIKGLIINFIHHFWPSLLDIPDFLMQFITPIVKCTKGKKSHTFFTLPEYEEWKEGTGNDAKGWTIKYYKGLGTSTSSEAKEYFSNLDIHEILDNDAITSGAGLIDMAFSKSKVEERKKWLNRVEKDTFLNYSAAQRNGVNYSEFINRELVLFSQYDNVRSIPHIMDGFKPSQRKVLYACFKKKLKAEIKVAQLAGYIGEHSAYHHGDMSLNGTIIGMAQSYCGSNNLNLLYPSGQFGTRRMGGKDHASARYIFTRLEKIARAIFHPDDDALLNYLNDDGLSIEPEYYMPVIPMVLVNGSDGIGTGWSSTIQNHDPREVIANIKKMINGEEPELMHPHFAGYTGEITAESGSREGSYIVEGKIERTGDTTLLITELPIGKWTQDYKGFLEGLMIGTDKSPSEISDFKENHTDTTVSFTVTASKDAIDKFEKEKGGLVGKFKLSTTISTKNMTLFDTNGKIHKYKASVDILRTFFHHRLEYYVKRKDMLLEKMRRELKVYDNKARFVEEVCKGDLVVSNRKRAELLADLQLRGYDLYPREVKKSETEEEDDTSVEEDASDAELAKGYEYLLGMKIWSLTFERAEELRRQKAEKADEVEKLEGTSPEAIWMTDLEAIEEALDERDVELNAELKREVQAQSKNKVRVAKIATAAAKKAKKSTKKKDEVRVVFVT
ncbi:DNA topoisomerase [Thalassiosira pseudonana CCMP1335]|uniref:DNA topoisomerase 2 n=1 Tax=Thalassiosira pseudonana TaxID=35128 RepID=B8C9L4_THAPS|nr:DNA topoisomerase [Thalassiosira pseudonana CCMP1335]EED89878.1 DNA topoisomerase [Thalassiosira pseudonana CCMP1335]